MVVSYPPAGWLHATVPVWEPAGEEQTGVREASRSRPLVLVVVVVLLGRTAAAAAAVHLHDDWS